MTPEDFRKMFVPKLTNKYLRESGKVAVTAGYAALSTSEKAQVQLAFEQGRVKRGGEILQKGRQQVALTQATTRINEIIADGNLSIDLELDELI